MNTPTGASTNPKNLDFKKEFESNQNWNVNWNVKFGIYNSEFEIGI